MDLGDGVGDEVWVRFEDLVVDGFDFTGDYGASHGLALALKSNACFFDGGGRGGSGLET